MEKALLSEMIDTLERIAKSLEKIESHLNSQLTIKVDLDQYCLDGDPYIQVHGHIQTSEKY